nr:classA [uncultured bacterium]AMP50763.1 classA [uncultured bacterium]AMP50779.1 classA [uncultured bacterium]AMP50886.1 classA [uncultured bacterium]
MLWLIVINIEGKKMRKKIYLIIILFTLLAVSGIYFYKASLTYQIKEIIAGKNAQVGVAIIHGDETWTIGQGKQSLMSVFKLFIAMQVLDKLEKDKTDINQMVTITEDMVDRNTYTPMLKVYPQTPFEIPMIKLIEFMVSESDNNAANFLMEYTGGAEGLENYLKQLGFPEIEIKVSEAKMTADVKSQLLNKAYPMDVIRLLKQVREGNFLSDKNKKLLDEMLIKTMTGENKIKKYLPSEVVIGHKTGSSDRLNTGVKIADNDVGFVRLADGCEYYLAVMVTDSSLSDEDNAELIAKVSKVVYDNFVAKK